jgi:hypothetical protein
MRTGNATGTVRGEIQPRHTHQIELGKVVSRTQDAADHYVPRIEFLKTTDVHLGRTWLRRSVGESHGLATTISEGSEPPELLAGKIAEPRGTPRNAYPQDVDTDPLVEVGTKNGRRSPPLFS